MRSYFPICKWNWRFNLKLFTKYIYWKLKRKLISKRKKYISNKGACFIDVTQHQKALLGRTNYTQLNCSKMCHRKDRSIAGSVTWLSLIFNHIPILELSNSKVNFFSKERIKCVNGSILQCNVVVVKTAVQNSWTISIDPLFNEF